MESHGFAMTALNMTEQRSLKVKPVTHERIIALVGFNGCRNVDEVIQYLLKTIDFSMYMQD